ncbi:glycoside hydrolase [Tricladium varicosporioides]|nr:glycoside hydrolase [Hymenoscyphus varicosporioides]
MLMVSSRLTYSSTIDDWYRFTSRLFLLSGDTQYQLFNLLNKEISFTVDTSRLPCGLSASVKLLSMDQDGGVARFPGNKAGAKYGTGYCDAKCSRDVRFVDGKANAESWTPSPNIAGLGTGSHGSCCMEIKVFEGNSASNTYAVHSCDSPIESSCSGDGCLSERPCDAVGCDLNPYRMGNTSFFGPGKVVDTNKPFTVVTQFITTDGTDSGTLKEVKRFYIQNGVKISTPDSSVTSMTGNSITSSFCKAQKSSFGEVDSFSAHGGLEAIGKALAKGMVLAISLNDGGDDGLEWLDGIFPATATPTTDGAKRGPCEKQGSLASLQTVSPKPVVSFGKIRVGDLGSTG